MFGSIRARLQRELSREVEKDATHSFFRKVNAHLFNIMKISKLPGEMLSFDAEYENVQSQDMTWPGQRHLQLKENCKIMMVWNKSNGIRNGSMGTFVEIHR